MIKKIRDRSCFGKKWPLSALEKEYPKIIKEHKIRAIGRPEIALTKVAENNPLGFKIKTSVLPEIALPDYKDSPPHRRASPKVSATDEDVSKTIESLRKSKVNKNEKGEELLPNCRMNSPSPWGILKIWTLLKNTIRLNLTEEKK